MMFVDRACALPTLAAKCLDKLLSFAHDFAKQDKTTQFDAGSKTAITQSILHGFAWYFLCTNANVLLIC